MFRRIALAAAIFFGLLAGAFAQAPPAVPALPDTERRVSYSASGVGPFAIPFALYGDGTDIDAWVEVWLNGLNVPSTDPTKGWTLSSTTGPIGMIPLPITNAQLTFNQAQTGTLEIVGARRPRRLTQF